jgi:aerobic-type carbon monoxide dehydrogenase small subunit (CoxS/CutS family)
MDNLRLWGNGSNPWLRGCSNQWLRTHAPELNTCVQLSAGLCTVCLNFKSVGACLLHLFYKRYVDTREGIVTQVETEGTQEIKIP